MVTYMNILDERIDNNKKLHRFFISISDEGTNVKWCKLNRNMFKNYLQERYGKKLSDRMVLFLDTNFGILLRSPFD
jgi:hypothetical protein